MKDSPPEWDGALENTASDDENFLFDDDLDHSSLPEHHDGPSWGLLLGSLVAILAIGLLVFDGMQTETFFFDVDQVMPQAEELVGKEIRVRGNVEPNSISAAPGTVESHFRISVDGASMTVVFNGALPDTFEEDAEVVTQGRFDEALVFHADEVLVKCPSRYEGAPPDVGEASQPQAAR